MTRTDPEPTGEARLKKRRNRFYRYVALALLGSLIAGMAGGVMGGLYEDGEAPVWVPLLACAILAIGLIWFTRDYFKRVDELDLMDNLWAHLCGVYGGMIVFGIWYFLANIGLVPFPSALAIVSVMIFIICAVYGLRKLGLR
ncbi:hypothetical protein [Alteriqipengyuania lutimaris]|uniref:Uncharacterized protein n=1 Tax=Alteriqipengyuania lutimaris TaxID=1538146 RepID=A0A395LMV5_9SPHN|nr:hypothetical protein [Alteriqipengyuania lutimaris]MBB3032941.1 uncharacterized membrane protein YdcZ (DUF606 family) [Alteriqipengyuania lutimaris]RDS77979.1 hypothetical protein DL238_10460 [Alteriqipengyuania lutimaris]